uniref:Isoprenylcysteine carboxylmethyltransferase family protein n=1 Tax=Desulfobacca acetoxidans TaxID=60893 RepID=A0A7V4G9H1_9BACT
MTAKPRGVSTIEWLRKPLTILAALVFLALVAMYRSRWEEGSPILPALFFLGGCILAGVGALGRMWCSLYVSGYKTTRLVATGPYSMCRHPLYFFTLLGALGVGLTTATLTLPALIALGFGLYYPAVIRAEEAKLRRKHQDLYEAYCQRTPAFFPRISRFTEPEEYLTHPRIFRSHLWSAVWFIWLIGVLEVLKAVQRAGLMPFRLLLY